MDLQEIQTNQIKTAKPIKKEISYDSALMSGKIELFLSEKEEGSK